MSNVGAFPVNVALSTGNVERTAVLPAGARREQLSVPARNWAGQVAIEARPVSGQADRSQGAAAVHYVRLRPTDEAIATS
jgi:hypothetical protein